MASASDHRAHAALQPADCLILLPQRLPAAVETSIGPAHYPADCTQSDAFLQPSLRARNGRANSNSFCIAGLPLRRPRDNTLVWKRQDERFALTVQAPEIGLPGGSSFIAGLPFGPKARLLAMWLATEAKDPIRRSDDRWIEIGKITDWLRAVGISPEWGPRGSVVATKDQFLRLAFAQFSMVFRREDGFQPFRHETLIEAGVFHDNDLEKVSTGAISDTKWPSGFLLSQGLRPLLQSVDPDSD